MSDLIGTAPVFIETDDVCVFTGDGRVLYDMDAMVDMFAEQLMERAERHAGDEQAMLIIQAQVTLVNSIAKRAETLRLESDLVAR